MKRIQYTRRQYSFADLQAEKYVYPESLQVAIICIMSDKLSGKKKLKSSAFFRGA